MNTEKHLKKNDEDKIWAERSFYAYETFCTVGILRRADEAKILRQCQRLALTVQQVLNVYDPQSELAVLCRTYKVGQKCKVSPMLFSFLEINLWMARRCMGAFDPTLGPVIRLGEKCQREDRLPGAEELDTALARSGYEHIHLFKNTMEVLIDCPGIELHPGASGKGFALDIIASYLKSESVEGAYMNFGGNVYVLGENALRTAVRHPKHPSRMMAVLNIKNEALSTSSWYEHYFEKEGNIYAHIIDPGTGQPAASRFLSVSCVTSLAVAGDILSTALYVLGREKGDAVLKQLRTDARYCPFMDFSPEIGYIAMDTHGRIHSNFSKSPGSYSTFPLSTI